MPYGQRNTILVSGLIFTGIILLVYLLSIVLLLVETGGRLGDLSRLRPGATLQPWWLQNLGSPRAGIPYYWKSAGVLALVLTTFIAGLVLRRLYQRTASAEIFFFLFFLFTLSLESLWTWNVLVLARGCPKGKGRQNCPQRL